MYLPLQRGPCGSVATITAQILASRIERQDKTGSWIYLLKGTAPACFQQLTTKNTETEVHIRTHTRTHTPRIGKRTSCLCTITRNNNAYNQSAHASAPGRCASVLVAFFGTEHEGPARRRHLTSQQFLPTPSRPVSKGQAQRAFVSSQFEAATPRPVAATVKGSVNPVPPLN
jgi:hypothetical protein